MIAGVLGLLAVPVQADPVPTRAAAAAAAASAVEAPPARYAVAMNGPLSWLIGSLSGSVYVRITDNLVASANIATSQNTAPGGVLGAIESETAYGGSIFDVEVGVVWYPMRRAWDGLTLEIGAIRRERNVSVWPEFDSKILTRSTEYGGRTMIGWSWLMGRHAFIAIAGGISRGYETGVNTDTHNDQAMPGPPTTTRFRHFERTEAEGYMRVGIAFGE